MGDLVALAAPHAGLEYSGGVAAQAYCLLEDQSFEIAVLVGPSHFVAFEGVAAPTADGFETPLGIARVDRELTEALEHATPLVCTHPTAHAREHSLEMQLPFLQRVAPSLPIVPLLVGRQTPETARALADALVKCLSRRRALLVASTDLSHYHDAATASRLDDVVLECVSRFDPEALQHALDREPGHACGGGPLVSVMLAARALGALDGLVLDYADSGDVTGDKSSVVGYMAAAFGRFRAAAERRESAA
jgi:AmmeMemoRadiSam system protein B